VLKTEKQPELDGKKHDGKHDPDQRCNQSDAIVKQIAGSERQNDGG
jgi:hypothetical protein